MRRSGALDTDRECQSDSWGAVHAPNTLTSSVSSLSTAHNVNWPGGQCTAPPRSAQQPTSRRLRADRVPDSLPGRDAFLSPWLASQPPPQLQKLSDARRGHRSAGACPLPEWHARAFTDDQQLIAQLCDQIAAVHFDATERARHRLPNEFGLNVPARQSYLPVNPPFSRAQNSLPAHYLNTV